MSEVFRSLLELLSEEPSEVVIISMKSRF